MFLQVKFSNGSSSYTYEVDSDNPPTDIVLDAIKGLVKCVYGLEIMALERDTTNSPPDEEMGAEEVRETLYDTVDEIVEQMFGHTDESLYQGMKRDYE